MVKILPHFMRYPQDVYLVFYQVAFAYAHSFVKLWADLTFWDAGWAGRNLDEVNRESKAEKNDSSFTPIAYKSGSASEEKESMMAPE